MDLDREYLSNLIRALCYYLYMIKKMIYEQTISMVSKEKEVLKGW